MRETTFKIIEQGAVEMAHAAGYMLVGGPDAVCFYIDPRGRAAVCASTESDAGCPVIYLTGDENDDGPFTVIEFTEFPGWRFHSSGGGKVIAIALVRRAAEK